MKASFVSSSAISQAMRYSMLRMQAELAKAEKEVSSGRVADVGLALGARTAQSVSLARDVERLGGLLDTNALAASRLSSTQTGLSQIEASAQTLLSTLTAGFSSSTGRNVLRTDGATTLEQITAILNTSLNGEHLFAGINTDVKPVTEYEAGSPGKTAFDAAFLTRFGFAPDDPAAGTITAADMADFIATDVEPQFLGAGWANWSSATDQPIVTRIALNETAETSVSANTGGVRKLAMAATMVSELLTGSLSDEAAGVLLDSAVEIVSQSIADLTNTQAATGLAQQRVSEASERLTMQIDIFERNILDLEGVDPYEASTRVSTLLSQIELSYSLTARFQELSLAKFLT